MKKKQKTSVGFSIKEVVVIVILSSIIAGLCAGAIVYNNINNSLGTNELKNNKYLEEFITSYYDLVDNYYEKIDEKEVISAAINAMYNKAGDSYTMYLNEEDTNSLQEKLLGKYNGIGIIASKEEDGKIFVETVYENTPAYNLGILKNDEIVAINNKNVLNLSITEAAKLIESNDNNTLVVKRDGQELTFNIKSASIEIPSLYSSIIENNIGYIKIDLFAANTYKQFKKELNTLEENGMQSLIIDVRDNAGGYLKSAADIVSLFLKKGKVIYSLEKNNSKVTYKDETNTSKSYNVVILMNENTASASEILISALKESYKAITIGSKTYGKGKVQQTKILKDGSMIKYTSSKWLTPSGENVDGIGIKPDFAIKNTEDEDKQLNKAIDILK